MIDLIQPITDTLAVNMTQATPTATGTTSSTLSIIKDFTSVIQSIGTIIALLIGAIWFIRRRQTKARADITHELEHWPLTQGTILLRVILVISNKGNLKLSIAKGKVRIRQVIPPTKEILDSLAKGETLIPASEIRVAWPKLDERSFDWSAKKLFLEPSETAQFHFDFFIEDKVRVIQIYSFLEEARPQIGWSTYSIHELTPLVEG